MNKAEGLSRERKDVLQRAHVLHSLFESQGHFTADEDVTVKWSTTPKTGLRPLRRLRRTWHVRTETRKVFHLNPPDNSVLMMDDGQLALKNEKTKRYIAFDFNAASSADFHIIKEVIDRWWKMPERIIPIDSPDTPH
jgi:ribosomal protein L11 methylase PrmA